MEPEVNLENSQYFQQKKRFFSRESEDSWPFMSQGEMLETLERLVCPLTSQTLRRWQKNNVISAPTYYNIGPRANIASYKLFLCAECYAAAILSLGKNPVGELQIPSSMTPKITQASIAYIRDCAYGFGTRPVLPHRAKIEKALELELPDMPDFKDLNLDYYSDIKVLADGLYAEYFEGCIVTWKAFFMEGMVKFGNEMKIRKADPLHNLPKLEI